MYLKHIVVIAGCLSALGGCYSAPYSPDTGYTQGSAPVYYPPVTTTTTTERTTTVQPMSPPVTTTTTTVQQTRP